MWPYRHQLGYSASNMTARSAPIGSSATALTSSNTIVARLPASYGGHAGSFGVLGFPVRANASHASLTLSASAGAVALPAVSRDSSRLSGPRQASLEI